MRGEIPFSVIRRVNVDKSAFKDSQEMTRVSIWTDYETIPFSSALTAKGMADYSLAEELRKFIGVDEGSEPPPLEVRLEQLLKDGKKAVAIKLMRRETGLQLKDSKRKIDEMAAKPARPITIDGTPIE